MQKLMPEENQIQIFQSADGEVQLDVSLQKETVWLSQHQMDHLFEKDVRTVNEHINNLFKEHELIEDSTIRKFRIVEQENNRGVTREVEHFILLKAG